MRNIATKVDGSTNLSAADFNATQDELENVVTTADDTLDPAGGADTDLNMLSKAIAGYAAASWSYQDSGAADAYVLASASNLKTPTKYFTGMMVVFLPGAANTGASTVNVAGLGVKNIKIEGSDPVAGELSTTKIVIMRYSVALGYFSVVSGAGTFTKRQHDHSDVANGGSLAANPLLLGYRQGCRPLYKTAADIYIEQGNIEINGFAAILASDLTVAWTEIDTGAEATSTWYYLYLVKPGTDGGAPTAKISATAPNAYTAALGGRYHPSQATWRCVGSFYNDSGDDIQVFTIREDRVYWDAEISLLGSGAATTFTNVDCSPAMPETSEEALLVTHMRDSTGTGNDKLEIRPDGATGAWVVGWVFLQNEHNGFSFYMPTVAQTIEYKVTDANNLADIDCWGYRESL